MFLDLLRRRNPNFVLAAMRLHQAGCIPANSFVLDLDAVEENARHFASEAKRLGLTTFAMTKQVGRSSGFCKAVMRGGIKSAVAVDMACARACARAGMRIGHLGHLVQVPRHEAREAANRFQPEYWTVFSETKANEASVASAGAERMQAILARIFAIDDTFYRGHEGGFEANGILKVADMIDALPGARFAGITTFPALLFDNSLGAVNPTANLSTLETAAEALRKSGRGDIEINAPGTTSSAVLGALADAGATQCEPGNGLHGTTPLHAVRDLPELPAVLYLTEISHHYGGSAFCFGGGLYIDPVFPGYKPKAIVSSEPTVSSNALADVEIPPPSAIDYYGIVESRKVGEPRSGDTVIFGFRGQAFVTRAFTVGVAGVSKGAPEVVSIENAFGEPANWQGDSP
ncbi:MAG: alanine racemase [Albidovulum sp.]|nr:alanine racemase [Albidovulum sp.]